MCLADPIVDFSIKVMAEFIAKHSKMHSIISMDQNPSTNFDNQGTITTELSTNIINLVSIKLVKIVDFTVIYSKLGMHTVELSFSFTLVLNEAFVLQRSQLPNRYYFTVITSYQALISFAPFPY